MALRRYQEPVPKKHGKHWTIVVTEDYLDGGQPKRRQKRVRLAALDTKWRKVLRLRDEYIKPLLVGVAITVYVFSVVAAFLVEVESTNPFWRRRMQNRINEMHGHYIVCGLGDTGRHAMEELKKTRTPHVAIELLEQNITRLKETHPSVVDELLYVAGDATEEEVLEKAGIGRAKGIVTALPQDKDNLVITVIVHQRFPKMPIVARAADQRFSERMLRAGAQSTVSPSRIGGLRMASELIRPHVVNFLDLMLKSRSQTLRVEEINVAGPPWAGRPLKDLQLHRNFNLLVLAIKSSANDQLWVNPPDTVVLQPGSAVIVLGDVSDVQRARKHGEDVSDKIVA